MSYLATSAGKMLVYIAREAAKGVYDNKNNQIDIPSDAVPGIVLRIETASGNLQFNPHIHCL